MKKTTLALICALTISGCTNAITDNRPIQLTTKNIADIKAAVRYDLIDPDSAKFRNIRAADIVRQDGNVNRFACGEVNSRNRTGGYSGDMAFAVKLTPDGVELLGVDQPIDRIGVINSYHCVVYFGENWRRNSG